MNWGCKSHGRGLQAHGKLLRSSVTYEPVPIEAQHAKPRHARQGMSWAHRERCTAFFQKAEPVRRLPLPSIKSLASLTLVARKLEPPESG